jgi:hypothetical protein
MENGRVGRGQQGCVLHKVSNGSAHAMWHYPSGKRRFSLNGAGSSWGEHSASPFDIRLIDGSVLSIGFFL